MEPIAETVDTFVVPKLRFHDLGCGKGVKPDASTHLIGRDSAALSMTSSQESVTSSTGLDMPTPECLQPS